MGFVWPVQNVSVKLNMTAWKGIIIFWFTNDLKLNMIDIFSYFLVRDLVISGVIFHLYFALCGQASHSGGQIHSQWWMSNMWQEAVRWLKHVYREIEKHESCTVLITTQVFCGDSQHSQADNSLLLGCVASKQEFDIRKYNSTLMADKLSVVISIFYDFTIF